MGIGDPLYTNGYDRNTIVFYSPRCPSCTVVSTRVWLCASYRHESAILGIQHSTEPILMNTNPKDSALHLRCDPADLRRLAALKDRYSLSLSDLGRLALRAGLHIAETSPQAFFETGAKPLTEASTHAKQPPVEVLAASDPWSNR
jgi:hypothetical protein